MAESDPALLRAAIAGDQAALAQLLEQHASVVRGVLADAIPARWQALLTVDDVLQQTWVDAFLSIQRFDPLGRAAFATWLTTLAKRNLIDVLRMLEAEKRGGQRQALRPADYEQSCTALCERLAADGSSPSLGLRRSEARAALEAALNALPAIQALVVRMYDIEQQPVERVAAAVGRSVGATYMLRARGLELLRQQLGRASQFLSGSA